MRGMNKSSMMDMMQGMNISMMMDMIRGMNKSSMMDMMQGMNKSIMIDMMREMNKSSMMDMMNKSMMMDMIQGMNKSSMMDMIKGMNNSMMMDMIQGMNKSSMMDMMQGMNISMMMDMMQGMNKSMMMDMIRGMNKSSMMDMMQGMNKSIMIDMMREMNKSSMMDMMQGMNKSMMMDMIRGMNKSSMMDMMQGMNKSIMIDMMREMNKSSMMQGMNKSMMMDMIQGMNKSSMMDMIKGMNKSMMMAVMRGMNRSSMMDMMQGMNMSIMMDGMRGMNKSIMKDTMGEVNKSSMMAMLQATSKPLLQELTELKALAHLFLAQQASMMQEMVGLRQDLVRINSTVQSTSEIVEDQTYQQFCTKGTTLALIEETRGIRSTVAGLEDRLDSIGAENREGRGALEDMRNGSMVMGSKMDGMIAKLKTAMSVMGNMNGSIGQLSSKADQLLQAQGDTLEELAEAKNATSLCCQDSSIKSNLKQLEKELDGIAEANTPVDGNKLLLGTRENPALSCKQIAEEIPDSQSGDYWVRDGSWALLRVYCSMREHHCANTTSRGWTRVGNFDITAPEQRCPAGFTLMTDPVRACQRTAGAGCKSIPFSTLGLAYERVCGRVKAYQYGSTNAFAPCSRAGGVCSIDEAYVDGVSITYGRSPRRHIWTYVAAFDARRNDDSGCPCERNDTSSVPSFVNGDYFCDTGAREQFQYGKFYPDVLWDKKGCGQLDKAARPPWFCQQLSQPTTDSIEVRVCADEDSRYEDIPVELVELYVQ